MHGARIKRHGDPEFVKQPARSHAVRLATEPSLHCVIYEGKLTSRGYGNYRAVWRQQNGEIPMGMQLDHRCRVLACVNPDHMELVTPSENIRRRTIANRYERERGAQSAEFWLLWDWSV
jgi:hypothetical protein